MMIITKLINYIKQSLRQSTNKEKITIDIGYKKISKILRREFLILGIFVIFYILYIFLLGLFLSSIFSFSFPLILMVVTELFQIITVIFPFIIVILFSVNILKIYKLKKILKLSITSEYLSTEEYKKFIKKCTVVYVFNSLIIFIIIFTCVFNYINSTNSYETRSKELKIEHDKYKEDQIKNEPKRIQALLLEFKDKAKTTQKGFTGYGIVKNNGNCLNLTPGSFFNPDEIFEPKTVKNSNWKNDLEVLGSLRSAGDWYVAGIVTQYQMNNMSDAKCFSDEDHFAYQVPSYLEDPYPTFYCVDDVHADVQKSNKQIKSSNCDDIDNSYIPSEIRPLPDIEAFTRYWN